MDTNPLSGQLLESAVQLDRQKILNPDALRLYGGVNSESPLLIILAAGKGTRFGQNPKCVQPVHGTPLARHSIDSFRHFSASPVVCLVGYRHHEVSAALGTDNVYVQTANPTGGTAFAAYEAFSVPGLLEENPLLIVTMGDRIVPSSIFRRLWETHCDGREADLTFLSAVYEPPKNRGKGRVVRDEHRRVVRIIEEKDIGNESDPLTRQALMSLTEGNCPLYIIRAATLRRYLANLSNANAQGQFYITDIVERISQAGGEIRTLTTTVQEPEYDLLCSDVTQPMDLALLEGILATSRGLLFPEELEVEEAARRIMADRTPGQLASIARQLGDLTAAVTREKLGFEAGQPIGIGISGGRLRIAFMHPDMVRFYGPAWQMPIGAGEADGEEQVVLLVQGAQDGRIHLLPLNPRYRENVNSIAADQEAMYPGDDVSDMHAYEEFGTRMSETLLLSLGYFSADEVNRRRELNLPLPPPSLWVTNSMRRPFALVGNAIASMRTLRAGSLGAKVQEVLDRRHFRGFHMVSTGSIPEGGFSSSSAVTVATKNAINELFGFGIPPDLLVHLACQAEYGTGVRAGSLDQATEQKGRTGQGTLMSSNPRDNYRILGTYPVPTDRIQIIFPYSVERDRSAWRWSWGCYGETPASPRLTPGETRKMTGKAAELAAILVNLPLETDFFKQIEDDLLDDGLLSVGSRAWIASLLRSLPLRASQVELRERAMAQRDWLAAQLAEAQRLDAQAAQQKATSTIESLFSGWRDPLLRRTLASGETVEESGVPLRAMLAYLFGEVAKNFYLIHHPEDWIEYVTRSQNGDCCLEIDPEKLPVREHLESMLDWERDLSGPELMAAWLERCEARFVNFNQGLEDEDLDPANPPEFHLLRGSSFFRGLALIDLAQAMVKRAFGHDAVAVRVNAAGQGDFFQIHLDKTKANPAEVKRFLKTAFYKRFGLTPAQDFVELHPGGGATGVRLSRYADLPQLIRRLQSAAGH